MAWKTLKAQSRAADAQSRAADAQSRAADAQMLTGYLGLGTLVVASLCLVKLESDSVKFEMEQATRSLAYTTEKAERDLAYKAEQASRGLAAAAAPNATVLLISRQNPVDTASDASGGEGPPDRQSVAACDASR